LNVFHKKGRAAPEGLQPSAANAPSINLLEIQIIHQDAVVVVVGNAALF